MLNDKKKKKNGDYNGFKVSASVDSVLEVPRTKRRDVVYMLLA